MAAKVVVLCIDGLSKSRLDSLPAIPDVSALQLDYNGNVSHGGIESDSGVVLWSSFATCKDTTREVMLHSDKLATNETWFRYFNKISVVDFTGIYAYLARRERIQVVANEIATATNAAGDSSLTENVAGAVKRYDDLVWSYDYAVRNALVDAIDVSYDLVVCNIDTFHYLGMMHYSDVAVMENVLIDLNKLVSHVRETTEHVLIVSARSMTQRGSFGGYVQPYGYWAATFDLGNNVRLTDVGNIVTDYFLDYKGTFRKSFVVK